MESNIILTVKMGGGAAVQVVLMHTARYLASALRILHEEQHHRDRLNGRQSRSRADSHAHSPLPSTGVGFPPSTSVSLANSHSTDFTTLVIYHPGLLQ
jgi:hypothetical protein